jgi:hypothetical protein
MPPLAINGAPNSLQATANKTNPPTSLSPGCPPHSFYGRKFDLIFKKSVSL